MNNLPYVYRLDHPVTGEFYIGYRSANKVPAEQDLGYKYFTSSKYVKPRFDEFNFQIIAEFFDHESAYEFEQRLIFESWGSSKMLNKHHRFGKTVFDVSKIKWHLSEETKSKMSKSKRNMSEVTRQKIRDAKKNISDETRKKLAEAQTGRKLSDETRRKMSVSAKKRCTSYEEFDSINIKQKCISM